MQKKAHKIKIEMTPGSAPVGLLEQMHESVTLINRIYSDVPKLDSEEVIERGLLLTKLEPTDEEIAKALIYVGVHELVTGSLEKWHVEGITQRTEFLSDWWAKSESDRQKFRHRLDELLKNPVQARTKHKDADLDVLRRDLLIVTDFDGQGADVHRFFPMTIEAAYTFVLQALYKKKHERWKRLRKCGHCQSVFIRKISEVGGRPRDYCTAECQRKADQKKALVRQRKQRQRNRK